MGGLAHPWSERMCPTGLHHCWAGEGQGTEEFKLERERGVSETGREKVK